ncbi:Holliday junction branch migration protein RuvA [Nocardioides yefusunii]|uniref:Holliday junction branch migration complex subunit RuvA n=1 Tax=Nocardioides yefusunii TaxID=2500546 RepID=A0ABW1QYV1_9ACTN|nr:Holliday junction branch migration protein RuvA [Nocardioides yefusunii]
MIAHVRGTVHSVTLSSAVLEVGGLGYEVLCTPDTLAGLRVGEEALLATSFVVREDSMTLFGFRDADEKSCFQVLQTASGVGPKLAQAVLAVMSPDALRQAIHADDAKALTKVPGIGAKGAAKIVIELKDRIGHPHGTVTSGGPTVTVVTWREQVVEGLVGLGYSAKDAEKAADGVAATLGDNPDVGVALRAALQHLSRG